MSRYQFFQYVSNESDLELILEEIDTKKPIPGAYYQYNQY